MDESFAKKIRTAAVAGWWTLLIAYCILLAQWFAYLWILKMQPAAMACLWGQGVAWPEIQHIWLWGMVAYKLVAGTMLFIVLWLTFWARKLSKK